MVIAGPQSEDVCPISTTWGWRLNCAGFSSTADYRPIDRLAREYQREECEEASGSDGAIWALEAIAGSVLSFPFLGQAHSLLPSGPTARGSHTFIVIR